MAARFEDLINGMVNIGFGVAATAGERGGAVVRDLSEKGERARRDPSAFGFSRSISDIFEQAGGVFSDVTARLGSTGDSAAARVLDELILARVRPMDATARIAFIEHVRALVNAVDDHGPQTARKSSGPCRSDASDAAGSVHKAEGATAERSQTGSCHVPISGADGLAGE